MKVGLYPMVADILHTGHIIAIEEASNNCDYLIVALNSNPEGKYPVQSLYERYIQLRAVKFIDEVIPYAGKVDLELLANTFNYDVRFLGEEYRDKEWDGKSQEDIRGIKPFYLKRKHGLSSTEIKSRIDDRFTDGR